mmetsp:Transcript_107203/g.301694  ORF Transcript_107203/g.301694 Transcript_107203/m.301694 type:complete len:267 (-) Transcript_107203:105-905(-)
MAAPSAAPYLNLYDIPELLPGAEPRANGPQRDRFERRCRTLHRESDLGGPEAHAKGASPQIEDLIMMFPVLDPDLVRTLAAEARSPQQAIDTLLALAAAAAEPGGSPPGPVGPAPPPPSLGVDDHEKFPTLVDSNGWQVVSQQRIERNADEDLGSAWRDRASAAAELPAPRPVVAPRPWGPQATRASRRRAEAGDTKDDASIDAPLPETDYEFRQRVGQRRAKNRAQYSRGARASHGARAGRDARAVANDESQDEASDGEASVDGA